MSIRGLFFFLSFFFSGAVLATPSQYLFGGSHTDGASGQVLEIKLLDGSTYLASTNVSPLGTESYAENFGWWSDKLGHVAGNYSYFAGYNGVLDAQMNNFFSFDLSGLKGTAVSATLKLDPYAASFPFSPMHYALFDVSTSLTDLMQGSGPKAAIFNDLGTGRSYGGYDFLTDPSLLSEISISLSNAAIADMNTRAGTYFSIGGSVASISDVPEPGMIALAMLGLFLVAASRVHRRISPEKDMY